MLDFKQLVWNVLATQYTQYSKYKSIVSTAECSSPSKCSPQTSVIRQLFLSNLRPQWVFCQKLQVANIPSIVSIRVQCLASDLSECLADIPSTVSTVFSQFRVSDLSECLAALFPRKAYFHAPLSQKQQTPTKVDFWNELKKNVCPPKKYQSV